MTTINAYLNFNGNCEEVFNFYASVFGSEPPMFNRFKAFHSEDGLDDTNEGEKIMHVALPLGNGTVLMGSDTVAAMGEVTFGDNFSLSLQVDSQEEADNLYKQLSAGGVATMPLAHAPWGDYFGMLTDQFGIQWMINHAQSQA
ncbi:MAG: VOC family protein [Anaerolineae bacterium]|nr:VOC family protein [Anaerolineae bacterium]